MTEKLKFYINFLKFGDIKVLWVIKLANKSKIVHISHLNSLFYLCVTLILTPPLILPLYYVSMNPLEGKIPAPQ